MSPRFTAVVAMASDRAIGLNGTMPWHLSEDLKLFKRLTMGHPVLMGRKTWESLGKWKPLPGRQNIVLTRDAAFEAEGAIVIHDIAELETYEEKQEFLEDMGLTESGCNRLIKAIYSLLTLQTFITAGEMEVKAWTFRKGWKAPQCAGVIHTDFEKGFIRAEVIKYDDYIKYGSEAAVREAGKMGVEGKEYVVQDGDIMHFRFNV